MMSNLRRGQIHFTFPTFFTACLVGLAATGGPAGAQVHPPENVVLLKHLDRGGNYSGNWGYTSPAGIELAISGKDSGTTFINATDPENAAEVAFIPGPIGGAITWREMATYGNFCYIVTEHQGAALQIVSLIDPLNPVLAATLNPPNVPFTTAHEIKIDQETGICYVAGTKNGPDASGLIILDLNPNPLSPTLRGTWPESGFSPANYVHDLSIQDSTAYCATIYVGGVVVLDVTNPGTPPVIGGWTYPDDMTHNTWPTADGSFLVTTDETTGGHLRMWDVRNLQVPPPQTDEWLSPTAAIVHNAYIRGNYCFMSHYKDGLRVVDVSDPMNIVAAGWYDTHPEDGSGYVGAWGCYCFAADPGIAYISDMQTGTYILRFDLPSAGIDDAAGGPAATPLRPVFLESFPNPFDRGTTIAFDLPGAHLAGRGPADLRVVDVSGRTVRVLSLAPLAGGRQSVTWDGRDEALRPVPGGVYFVRLSGPGFVTTGRLVRTR